MQNGAHMQTQIKRKLDVFENKSDRQPIIVFTHCWAPMSAEKIDGDGSTVDSLHALRRNELQHLFNSISTVAQQLVYWRTQKQQTKHADDKPSANSIGWTRSQFMNSGVVAWLNTLYASARINLIVNYLNGMRMQNDA